MKPYTTSWVDGALNIEVCDDEVNRRARAERFRRTRVHQAMGEIMNVYCPVHFAGFYDERMQDLFLSCLKDEVDKVKGFDGFKVKVS